MNNDEDYGFDVAGYIHLPKVFSDTQVASCRIAIDIDDDEGVIDVLKSVIGADYLEALCGTDYIADGAPWLVEPGATPSGAIPISAPTSEDRRRLRYLAHGDTRVSKGVRVFLSLAAQQADAGPVLVPASHNRLSEPPADFLSGADDIGMTEMPRLQAGDLLICAATLLYGISGVPDQLVELEFVSSTARPREGYPLMDAPEWTEGLTAEQKAIVGIRTTGLGGIVTSDGEQTQVTELEENSPSIRFRLDADSQPEPEELWFWDVRGYLVLRGVMDAPWLAAANQAVDAAIELQDSLPEGHPTRIEEVPEQVLRENDWTWPEDTSPRLRGDTNRPRIGGLYQLPEPHCDAFRRMIGHPAIVKRLNWLLGYGFRESTEPMCCVYPTGTTGGSLHGQNPEDALYNGRQLVEQVNVAWALQDESPGFGEDSGGFICVPGSHKAHFPIPRNLHTSIDLPQVYKPAMKAGDVLFFGGLAHGTTAWRSSWSRRTAIQFMGSHNVALPPGSQSVGWRWSSDPSHPSKLKAKEA